MAHPVRMWHDDDVAAVAAIVHAGPPEPLADEDLFAEDLLAVTAVRPGKRLVPQRSHEALERARAGKALKRSAVAVQALHTKVGRAEVDLAIVAAEFPSCAFQGKALSPEQLVVAKLWIACRSSRRGAAQGGTAQAGFACQVVSRELESHDG